MRKTTARILGLLLTIVALTAAAPKVEATQDAKTACTLLCIQGYHCCVQGSNQTCVPETQACK
jgi:hypothetical protein